MRSDGVFLVLLAIAFCASGGAGLLAEQGFEKLLGTLLGVSTPASSAVLATYFGGLTLGGWLYARRRSGENASPARSLVVYAVLEIVIAIACVVLAVFFDRLVPLLAPVLRLGASRPMILLMLRLFLAALWTLPITVPMGATFPAVVDALDMVRESQRGRAISAFYAMNLLGAVLAAGFGPWLIFPRVGVDGAILCAAALDTFAAVIAGWNALRERSLCADAAPRSFEVTGACGGEGAAVRVCGEDDPAGLEESADARVTVRLIAIAALSGFILFSLEVVWTHLIGTVIGSSVYAFATMLTVVLAGLGSGAIIGGVVAERLVVVPGWVPGLSLAGAGVALLARHGAWPEAPHALAETGRLAYTFVEAEKARAWMAIRLLFTPSVALGTVYPLLLRLEGFPRARAGSTTGRMGAANAFASIAGAFLTGFVFIPTFGSERTLLALAALSIGAAILVASSDVKASARGGTIARSPRMRAAIAILAVGALVQAARMPPWDILQLTSGEQVYFHRAFVLASSRLRFFREDARSGFTTVVENTAKDGGVSRVLLTNGKFQGNDIGEMAAQDGFALVPMLFSAHWDEAMVIGLGTGRSAHVVATMNYRAVTIAEIAPAIIEAATSNFPDVNGSVLSRPNVRVIVEDARNSLLLDTHTYDLVSIEITSVWFAGATNLYSREFYALAKKRLRPGGVLQQWVQLHHIGTEDIETAIASMHAVFPYVSLFVVGQQGILIGTNDPQVVRGEALARLAAHTHELGPKSAAARVRELLSSRLLSPSDVDALVELKRPLLNTDRNRRLEYTTPRYALERGDLWTRNVLSLVANASFEPPQVEPGASGDLAEVARAVDSATVRSTFVDGEAAR